MFGFDLRQAPVAIEHQIFHSPANSSETLLSVVNGNGLNASSRQAAELPLASLERSRWPAPGSKDTELRCLLEQEVGGERCSDAVQSIRHQIVISSLDALDVEC